MLRSFSPSLFVPLSISPTIATQKLLQVHSFHAFVETLQEHSYLGRASPRSSLLISLGAFRETIRHVPFLQLRKIADYKFCLSLMELYIASPQGSDIQFMIMCLSEDISFRGVLFVGNGEQNVCQTTFPKSGIQFSMESTIKNERGLIQPTRKAHAVFTFTYISKARWIDYDHFLLISPILADEITQSIETPHQQIRVERAFSALYCLAESEMHLPWILEKKLDGYALAALARHSKQLKKRLVEQLESSASQSIVQPSLTSNFNQLSKLSVCWGMWALGRLCGWKEEKLIEINTKIDIMTLMEEVLGVYDENEDMLEASNEISPNISSMVRESKDTSEKDGNGNDECFFDCNGANNNNEESDCEATNIFDGENEANEDFSHSSRRTPVNQQRNTHRKSAEEKEREQCAISDGLWLLWHILIGAPRMVVIFVKRKELVEKVIGLMQRKHKSKASAEGTEKNAESTDQMERKPSTESMSASTGMYGEWRQSLRKEAIEEEEAHERDVRTEWRMVSVRIIGQCIRAGMMKNIPLIITHHGVTGIIERLSDAAECNNCLRSSAAVAIRHLFRRFRDEKHNHLWTAWAMRARDECEDAGVMDIMISLLFCSFIDQLDQKRFLSEGLSWDF